MIAFGVNAVIVFSTVFKAGPASGYSQRRPRITRLALLSSESRAARRVLA